MAARQHEILRRHPDGGDGLRDYLKALGSTEVHPLLTGWLDKLEPYRTGIAGFQDYWAEWDRYRAEINAFLGRYDEFKTFFHRHSYTGNQLGCAAALAACASVHAQTVLALPEASQRAKQFQQQR